MRNYDQRGNGRLLWQIEVENVRAEKRNSIFCAFFGERIKRGGGGGSLNFLLHDARIAHIYTEHWYDVLLYRCWFSRDKCERKLEKKEVKKG